MSKNRIIDLPTDMRPASVAPRLVALRLSLGLEKAEMADMLGVDRSAWTKYEAAQRPVPDRVAYLIAERFDVPMDFLYRGSMTGIEEPLRGEIFRRLLAARATS